MPQFCEPLSNHPIPHTGETIGKWIERLAIENLIPISYLLNHIGTYARDWGFLETLSKLTNFPLNKIKLLENEFKDKFWEMPLKCPIKGCDYENSNFQHHLMKEHSIGKICDLLKIEESSPPDYSVNSAFYSHKWITQSAWAEIKSYPGELQLIFLDLKAAMYYFLAENCNPPFIAQHQLPEKFLGKFCCLLSKHNDLSRAFTRAGGIMGDFGLKWSMHQIRKWKFYFWRDQWYKYFRSGENF